MMEINVLIRLLILGIAIVAVDVQSLRAEQPIFDEMPRWKGGWGMQFMQEHRTQKGLYDDGEIVDRELGLDAHLFHVQGVYT
jgi:hypothetical protein